MDWLGKDGDNIAALWDDGKSAGEIAEIYGVSRNTICSGIYRLKRRGLCSRIDDGVDNMGLLDVQRLKSLIDAGHSMPKIAEMLGRSYNSVKARIGRMISAGTLDRKPRSLNIGANPSTYSKPRSEERVAQNTATGQSLLKRVDSAMTGEGVPLLEIRPFRCRYITGGAPEWRMCGEPVKAGSWCRKCRAIVYTRAA